MTPLFLITLGGITVSGRLLAVVAVVVIVVIGVVWFLATRAKRG